MNAAAFRPAPAARRRPAAGFSCAAATLNLPSMNDVATPGVEASDDISDEALMLAYAAGRAGAFEQLYSRHRTRLYRFLLRQLRDGALADDLRSEEHTSELQSLMRISYAVFCLKKKKTHTT